jgi:putative methionine-R-sulfoxide reductase with GAF domain
MPCNSIITQSIDLAKCSDLAMLKEAIATVDMQGCYLNANRQLVGDIRYVGKVADEIKRAYAKKSVYKAAKQNGWQVRELTPNKLQIVRR